MTNIRTLNDKQTHQILEQQKSPLDKNGLKKLHSPQHHSESIAFGISQSQRLLNIPDKYKHRQGQGIYF